MRSIWSSPSVRQMRTFLDDYITSRTFLEPWPSGIAIHAWLFGSNMRQCFLILKSWCPHFNSDALPPRIWCAWFFRNVSYGGSCLSTLARLVKIPLIPGKCLPFMPWALRSWSTKLGPCWFLMTVLEFATEWTAQTVLQRVLWHKFARSESCHLQAFVWNDRWNARIWPWTISFDAGRTGSITGDVAWWIASIRLLPQQNDWTLDSFDRIRILLWQLFARAARYSQTSKHPLECFAFNPHDYCDEILGTIWTSNLTVHSCWVLQLHWYSTPE